MFDENAQYGAQGQPEDIGFGEGQPEANPEGSPGIVRKGTRFSAEHKIKT